MVWTTQKINEAVGHRLRLIREAAGYTQLALGDRISRSYNAIFRLENGKTTLGTDDLFLLADGLDVSPLVILQDLITAEDLLGLIRALEKEREDAHQQIAQATERLDAINICTDAVRRMLPADGSAEHRDRCSSSQNLFDPEPACGIRSDPPELAWMLVDALVESKIPFWQGLMLAGNTTQAGRTAEEIATDGYVLGDLRDALGESFAWMSDWCTVEYGCPITVEMPTWLNGLVRNALARNTGSQKSFRVDLDVQNLNLLPSHMASMLAEWSVHSFLETWREDMQALIQQGQPVPMPKTAAEFWAEHQQPIRRWLYSWYNWALARGYCYLKEQSGCTKDGGFDLKACVAAQIARWSGFFEAVNCTAVEVAVESR